MEAHRNVGEAAQIRLLVAPRRSQDANGVDVTLSDGERLRCDLLVGADGIHSETRALVLDGADPRRVADMAIATWRRGRSTT